MVLASGIMSEARIEQGGPGRKVGAFFELCHFAFRPVL